MAQIFGRGKNGGFFFGLEMVGIEFPFLTQIVQRDDTVYK